MPPTLKEGSHVPAFDESIEVDEKRFRVMGNVTTTADEDDEDMFDGNKSDTPKTFSNDNNNDVGSDDDSDDESTMRRQCGRCFYVRREFFWSMISNMFFVIASSLYVALAVQHVKYEEKIGLVDGEALDEIFGYEGDDDWYFYNEYYMETGMNYTDDNLQVFKGTGTYITVYQTIYFFAALCFVISGSIDFIRDRSLLSVIFVFAGGFGLASACVVNSNEHLSSIFNSVCIHLFLFEAVGVFFRNYLSSNKVCLKFMILFANMCWVLGTLLDLVFSYLFLFKKSSIEIAYASIFSASLWLVCALLYIIATIWDECESSKKYKAGLVTEEEGDENSSGKDDSNTSHDE